MASDDRTIPVRVVVADDHLMFRRGVCAALEMFSEQVQVIGEASNVEDPVQIVERLQPGLVLLDLQLPDADDLELLTAYQQGGELKLISAK